MQSHSRSLQFILGLALALLTLSSLAVALAQGRNAAAAQQQAQAWKNYAMATHRQALLAVHEELDSCRTPPRCIDAGTGNPEQLLPATEQQARLPGSEPGQPRGLSF